MANTDILANVHQAQLGEHNYASLYHTLQAWRRAGGPSDTVTPEFNRFDTPSTLYFRIFFDFSKGLLGPTSDYLNQEHPDLDKMTDELWNRDLWGKQGSTIGRSALDYLILNNEWERADALRDFINLLSNINVNSPWYFSQIDGVGEILDRTEFTEEQFSVGEIKSVTIKCLPDAFDNRIGTLLDLYREACYSWQLHKEIVPANLRRFDMYIYIFSSPIRGVHAKHQLNDMHIAPRNMHKNKGAHIRLTGSTLGENVDPVEFASFDQNSINVDNTTGKVSRTSTEYLTSSKLIQLMDCEINMNSVKSGYPTLDNQEGFQQTYEIPIKVNYAMEQRYNEVLLKRIGDFVIGDMDLPGDTEKDIGKLREPITKEADADKALKIDPADDRLDKESLKTGQVNPDKNIPLVVYDKTYPPRLTDTSIGGQIDQLLKTGRATLSSWTDIRRLAESAKLSVASQIRQLIWGNLFETNLQDISSQLSSGISSFSSKNILENKVNGWIHEKNIGQQRNDLISSLSDTAGSIFDR